MKGRTETLSRLAEAHRSLLSRLGAVDCACPDATLGLGAAVELHRTLMGFVPEASLAVLDENVVEEIDAEGGNISEHLTHLATLKSSEPRTSEIDILSAALLKRIQAHLERCDRAVFRPLSRFYLEKHGR